MLDFDRVLITQVDLRERVRDLANEISRDHVLRIGAERPEMHAWPDTHVTMRPTETKLLVVSVLMGSFIFVADLVRQLKVPCQVDFMSVSSYGDDTNSSGKVRIEKDISISAKGRHVLIVDDILDSGRTLAYLKEVFQLRQPASLKTAVLLDKPPRREVPATADYVGFTIADYFVVGYGLDYAQDYRELPFIGVLKQEARE